MNDYYCGKEVLCVILSIRALWLDSTFFASTCRAPYFSIILSIPICLINSFFHLFATIMKNFGPSCSLSRVSFLATLLILGVDSKSSKTSAQYQLDTEYSGTTFFDGFNFFTVSLRRETLEQKHLIHCLNCLYPSPDTEPY